MKELQDGFYNWAPAFKTNSWADLPQTGEKRFLIEIAFKYNSPENFDKLIAAKSAVSELTAKVNENVQDLVATGDQMIVIIYIY